MLIYFINFISWIMRLILPFDGRDTIKVQIDYAIDYELNPVHYAFALAIKLVEIAGVRPNSFIDGFPSVRYMCEKLDSCDSAA